MSTSPELQRLEGASPLPSEEPKAPIIRLPGAKAGDAAALDHAIASACHRIPPLWPLRSFVAVNPFLGLREHRFLDAMQEADRLFHGRGLMPLSFYREQYAQGRITEPDLRSAIAEAPDALGRPELGERPAEALLGAVLHEAPAGAGLPPRVETLAEALDRLEDSRLAAVITDEISKWCAARFDWGQAAWAQPWRELAPWPAWREAALVDRAPELRGIAGFRDYVAGLPDEPWAAIATVLAQLGVAPGDAAELLTRELASIAGWAGHVQGLVRAASFEGREDDSLVHLLAIRLAFDGALDRLRDGCGALLVAHGDRPERSPADAPLLSEWELRAIWQLAYEARAAARLLARLASGPAAAAPSAERPRLQAVFCIDVRSEVLRRHLEAESEAIRTIGFAGFFGFPIEYREVGSPVGTARCPALIAPGVAVDERGPEGAGAEERVLAAQQRHERFAGMRKLSVGAYPLVETLGHFFGLRLLSDSLGWTRPQPGGALFRARGSEALAPSIEPATDGTGGVPLAQRIELAEGALRNMGLTRDFAEVVLLCGHGSSTTNNPYGSGLDCGACGGHRGDVNARVAAAVLQDPQVRAGLSERGIAVPDDTVFVAGLHDTTRDEVRLLDADHVPAGLRRELEGWLDRAGAATRDERSGRLGETAGPSLARRLRRRTRDWSELRPEWGLAGNAAFVAAPRRRTRGLDLGGRAFLHDYDAEEDPEGAVLELVLTAPLVVASWINLQYYASTTDNEVFGCGDKALHNVVGRHGVVSGNRSDLRVGLPWQSVHDRRAPVHEPLRLTAVVEAPIARIEEVLSRHPDLRETLENGWVHLLAWDADDGSFRRFRAQGTAWEEVPSPPFDDPAA